MSNCIKELYEYDLVQKRCRCSNILFKSNFHKNLGSKDGLDPRWHSLREETLLR